jgi:hypothetical protein
MDQSVTSNVSFIHGPMELVRLYPHCLYDIKWCLMLFVFALHACWCLIRGRNCLPFKSTRVRPWILEGSVLLIFLVFCFVCLRPLSWVPKVSGLRPLSWVPKVSGLRPLSWVPNVSGLRPLSWVPNALVFVLCLEYSMSLECPFLIALSVFSNVCFKHYIFYCTKPGKWAVIYFYCIKPGKWAVIYFYWILELYQQCGIFLLFILFFQRLCDYSFWWKKSVFVFT